MQEAIIHHYESRPAIHPRAVNGRFRRLKTAIMTIAFTVFFGLPWVPWARNVGPDQAVLFDIGDRKFYLFDLVVQPEQIFWLTGFLVIAALLLFLITGLVGRAFCGFFCFQTLWTDLFVQIERRIQGNQRARQQLDQQPWTADKLRKKLVTWTLFLTVGFSTGITFTLYWGEAGVLLSQFFQGIAPAPMYVTTLLLTTSTVVMAGLAREAVCMHMCPYARFQSAMVDKDTRIVSYDRTRGERDQGRSKPRKNRKQRADRINAGVGDCVDCNYCVHVCPTGVDIREGLQIGCIQCGLCIDACTDIMGRLNWGDGLIRFSAEKADAGETPRWLSPKTVGYGVTLVTTTALLLIAMAARPALETSVHQTRNPLYVELHDGRIQNRYIIKLKNQTDQPQTWQLSLDALPDAELDTGHATPITLPPLQAVTLYTNVKRPRDSNQTNTSMEAFHFLATPVGAADTREPVKIKAGFYTPRAVY